ncbi:glycosyltransferase family 4 protein [Enterobacter pasteurii]|uniref:glycosyltransferase family 4 protein n=1 Tax=Enterobacter pasteurii TaxID=3029761 RepID=UPI0011DE3966|nr:glycosyltransferase family 4 protein [Enterobacter pasteurii]QLA70004.1 glycosyltransferase family 4 protein [Enterobacter pasteurii]
MKNICFVNSYACLGGAEKSLQSLIVGFRNKGYHITAVVGEDGPLCEWLYNEKIEHCIIPQPSLKSGIGKYLSPVNLLKFLLSVRHFLKKNNVDIVHVNTFRSRLYCSYLKKIYKCKLIAHVRDIEPSSFNEFLISKYDYTIAISKAVEECLLKDIKYSPEIVRKIKVIYNGVEETELTLAQKASNNIVQIAMFSRYDEWKCQHVLIEAIKLIRENNEHLLENVVFKLYGAPIRKAEVDYYAKIVSLVEKYGLKNHVIFMGFCCEPLQQMRQMDLIVCPSDNEPFGRVVIEAMSLKKVVFASGNGGIIEILGQNFGELTFRPRDPDSLSRLLINYVENKKQFDGEYKDKLYEEYKSRFSIEQLINNIEKLYREE